MAGRPPTDVFRPCLPLDPFAALDQGPWRPSIPPHADPPSAVLVLGEPALSDLYPILFSPSLAQSLIVLVTHAPPYIPQKPSSTVRILRLTLPLAQDSGALRLVSLLERADRAVRHFRTCDTEWSRKLVQLAENTVTGEFDVEESYSPSTPPSSYRFSAQEDVIKRYPSPAPSAASSISSSSSAASSNLSVNSSSSKFLSRRRRAAQPRSSSPTVDRAFDAIIDFLPNTVPDKLLLKHAILVSTLTTSFFAAPPAPLAPPPSSYSPSKPKHRLSIFSNRSSSHVHAITDSGKENQQPVVGAKKNPRRFSNILRRHSSKNEFVYSAPCSHDSLPLSAGNVKGKIRSHQQSHQRQMPHESERKAHLIHVLPAHVYSVPSTSSASSSNVGASTSNGRSRKHPSHGHGHHDPKPKPKLVQSIEQFLLAYGYPLQSMSALSSPTSGSAPPSRRMSTASTISAQMFASLSGDTLGQQKPIPFLLPAGVLGSAPSGGKLTIGEILLMGGLDVQEQKGEEMVGMGGFGVGEGRVWIASADEVVWDDPPSPSKSNPVNHLYVGAPEPRKPVPASFFSSSPPNASRPAPPSVSLSSASPIKPQPIPSKRYTAAPSTLSSKPITIQTSAPPSALPSSRVSPPRPRKLSRRSSSSPPDDHKVKGEQQLPTPPESSSSLEDDADATPYKGITRTVSSSAQVTQVRTPSWSKAKSDVGQTLSLSPVSMGAGAGLSRHPSSKRGHYTTTSAAAAAAKLARTQQPQTVEEKAVKQKRRSSFGRVLMGIGKLVGGGPEKA